FDAYDLIDKQLKYGAAFTGVFNVVWYSLQPLELGMRDTSHQPTLKDGIFFPEFVEGRPGMQPERLGPYCTTLNPGYDPNLPLYRPWPMLEAIRDVYAGKTDSRWAKQPVLEKNDYNVPADRGVAGFIAGPNSVLEGNLRRIDAKIDRTQPYTDRRVVIVDAQFAPVNTDEAAKIVKALLKQNKTILILGIDANNFNWINSMLPDRIEVTDRKAFSLLVCQKSPVLAGIDNAILYFCESNQNGISGLAGPLVDRSTVLLKACDTDWRRWNGITETAKTVAVLRSEREAKTSGAALVLYDARPATLLLCTINPSTETVEQRQMLRRLLGNIGVQTSDADLFEDNGTVFGSNGYLNKALVCGSFPNESFNDFFKDATLNSKDIQPKEGDIIGQNKWRVC
ncbi:MAG TPA: hypothetical protein VIJ25_00655, partial [Methylococcales bacterium]